MKNVQRFILFALLSILNSNLYSQISNLVVNGSTTHFTIMSGSTISWSYNLPVGGAAVMEIWIDANSNGIIEPAADVLWQFFYQVDGQSNGDGPPDMDGEVNGQIMFSAKVGLAPADYIISVTNNSLNASISGTVTPLLSPVFTISGTVSVPPGKSAQYLILNFEGRGVEAKMFWCAITDVNGYFEVRMDSDTSGNPWRLKIDNPYRMNPSIQTPESITLFLNQSVSTNYANNNFQFLQVAAEIKGTVKDENNNPRIGFEVFIFRDMGSLQRNTKTDLNGAFSLGLLSNELPASNVWLGSGKSEDSTAVSAGIQLPTINSGDVITRHLKVYSTNSIISGNVKLNGNTPNMNLAIYANVLDTAFIRTHTDFSGNYRLHVTDKFFNYTIGTGLLPPNYYNYTIIAHPGQTNVNFNFTLADIKSDPSSSPSEFTLLANFPNPFNPSTKIKFTIPNETKFHSIPQVVTLKVYDVMGNEIATLMNEYKPAGEYEVDFNISSITHQTTSGVYFYQLRAGEFIQTKKMLLIK